MDINSQPPQAPAPEKDGMSTAALVCGILSVVVDRLPILWYFTPVLAVLGIVFGVKGRRQALTPKSRKKATAGMVLGIIGAVLSVFYICAIIFGAFITASMEHY